MKYSVGDKVRVREDLVEGEYYYNVDGEVRDSVVSEMLELSGQEVTIQSVIGDEYALEEDICKWGWTDGMFVTTE